MTIQELQFKLMKKASFNSFDGERVVNDLKNHPEFWSGAVMGRVSHSPLICLRDIEDNCWNVDTLYILARKGKEKDLELLVVKNWNVDEIDYLTNEEKADLTGSSGQEAKEKPNESSNLLRVWWD